MDLQASLRTNGHFTALSALAFLVLSLALPPLRAQTFDATTLREPTDLGVIWLVKPGDDPSYAQADLDDSQWMRVDPNISLKRYFPNSRPDVMWYRLHVKVAPNQSGLALEEYNLTSAFEIYVNGERLIRAGKVKPYVPSTFSARLLKRIPDAAISTSSLVIAMRVNIASNEWAAPFPGFYPYNLALGQQAGLSDRMWLITIGDNALAWFYQIAGLGLGIIALALFTAQSQQREYLWIFLLFLVSALQAPLQFYLLFHNLPAWSAYVNGCFQIANLVLLVLMFLALLRMQVPRWLQAVVVLAAVAILYNSMHQASGTGSSFGVLLSLTPQLALIAGVIPVLLIVHWRRGNREAGILLVPAVVASLSIYLQLSIFLAAMIPGLERATVEFQRAVFNWKIGPFTVNVTSLDGCLFVLSLAVIIVFRSTRIAQQQAHLETEMAAAREVQQIILPEQIESMPEFAIESVYAPAQQVGGDFFQILPAPEGSMLVVIGDVAGKGLPAAMLVSVLVGAIRGVADYTSDPAEMLANLNERLVGRVERGFSTAQVARIFPDGAVVMSNAGHLPPYLDGWEVPIPGALPLGAKAGVRYEIVRFQMPRGSRLTFYSDGIVEAQNAKGELFGFERGRELSTEPAAKIVEAAKRFGQQDDMTVIAVTRDTAPARDAQPRKVSVPAPALVG